MNPYGRVFLRAAVGSVDQDTNIDITISVSVSLTFLACLFLELEPSIVFLNRNVFYPIL